MEVPDKKRILIADDVDAVTTLLVTALEIAGFEVVVCRDGQTAFELGLEGNFDLAIIDQLMPGLLGIEVLRGWKEAGIRTPVIVLSGVEDDEIVVGTLESGAADFIHKPFTRDEILGPLQRSLARNASRI